MLLWVDCTAGVGEAIFVGALAAMEWKERYDWG